MLRLRLKLFLATAILPVISQLSFAIEPKQGVELAKLTISSQPSMQMVYLDARLEAINQSTISAQTSGIVESIKVDINDQVKAGQTLIIINDSQQAAGLSQAQANLAQALAINEDAQVLVKRNRSLFNKKTLSQGELDSSIAQAKSTAAAVLAAKALVKQAEEQLSYTHITAPYAGIVSQRMVEVGELVNPGQALLTGFAAQPLRAITRIPQHLVTKLNALSDDAIISIKSQGKNYPATRYTLFPYADSRYSSVQARIELAPLPSDQTNAQLVPGAWVEVALPIGKKEAIHAPKSAIIQQGEVASLYVIDKQSGKLKLRYVRLGNNKSSAKQIEILSGLKSGEVIAINGITAAMHSRELNKLDSDYQESEQ